MNTATATANAAAEVEVVATKDPAVGLGRATVAGYPIQVGPMKWLAEERAALMARKWKHFEARQLGATIGAELHGVDITRPLDEKIVAEIREALHAYKVIFFRDQPLSAQGHVEFAQSFGELEIHPFLPGNTGRRELVRFEKSADVAGYENAWHHDVTWRECPSMGAVLHCVKAPAIGGDTLFADMCAAYDGLDAATKDRIEGLVAVHDFMSSFGRQVPADRKEEFRNKYPAVEHPVVCRHDVTGRRFLYLNRYFVSHIKGIDADESHTLIDLVCRQADYPEYQCRFKWTDDSVAFWDNRAVQHYAASDYWPEPRVMERASVMGSRPVG